MALEKYQQYIFANKKQKMFIFVFLLFFPLIILYPETNTRNREQAALSVFSQEAWNAARRRSVTDVENAINSGYRFDFLSSDGVSPLLISLTNARDTDAFNLIYNWEKENSPDFSGSFSTRNEYLSHALLRLFNSYRLYSTRDITNNLEIVELLLEAGADPLILTTIRNNERVFSFTRISISHTLLLIRYGLPVNIRDTDFDPFLIKTRDASEILSLLKMGADPNIRDGLGRTPIMRIDDSPMINILIENGADPNIKDNNGNTVMHNNLNRRRLNILVNAGADVNAVNNDGFTPIMIAAAKEENSNTKHDLIQELLGFGADPFLRSNDGKNLLFILLEVDNSDDYFLYKPNPRTVRLLLDLGVNPSERDNRGNSALSITIRIKSDNLAVKQIQAMLIEASSIKDQSIAIRAAKKQRNREILPKVFAISLPSLAYMGIAIYSRENIYRNNPTDNTFGYINTFVTGFALGAGLTFLTFVTLSQDELGIAILGAIAAPIVGIITGIAFAKNNRNMFSENRYFYYGSSVLLSSLPILIFSLSL